MRKILAILTLMILVSGASALTYADLCPGATELNTALKGTDAKVASMGYWHHHGSPEGFIVMGDDNATKDQYISAIEATADAAVANGYELSVVDMGGHRVMLTYEQMLSIASASDQNKYNLASSAGF
jgi:hypothetical protein